MLKPENRLKKIRDFNLIMKHGRWASGQFLRIKTLKLADFEEFFPKKEDPEEFKNQLKIAFAVGLKVSKSAVKRNRIKRQIREVLRLLIKESKLKTGYYVLIVASKEVLDKNHEEIKLELEVLLKKARIL